MLSVHHTSILDKLASKKEMLILINPPFITATNYNQVTSSVDVECLLDYKKMKTVKNSGVHVSMATKATERRTGETNKQKD